MSQVDVVGWIWEGRGTAGLHAAETSMRPTAGIARSTARAQTAASAIQNCREERFESWEAGSEDSEAELQHVPDVEPVLKGLVRHVEELDLQAGFEDSGDACGEAEREDHNEGGFGSFVYLQFEDDGDRENGEEDVGCDVDNGVPEADEAIDSGWEAARAGFHSLCDAPACGDGCALE